MKLKEQRQGLEHNIYSSSNCQKVSEKQKNPPENPAGFYFYKQV
jgi:hypothetical protein